MSNVLEEKEKKRCKANNFDFKTKKSLKKFNSKKIRKDKNIELTIKLSVCFI